MKAPPSLVIVVWKGADIHANNHRLLIVATYHLLYFQSSIAKAKEA
jgi:hypothetical protein